MLKLFYLLNLGAYLCHKNFSHFNFEVYHLKNKFKILHEVDILSYYSKKKNCVLVQILQLFFLTYATLTET